MMRHSEERSNEESLFCRTKMQEGFLASLGMTTMMAFSATCIAAYKKELMCA